jgi:hypothetical protein
VREAVIPTPLGKNTTMCVPSWIVPRFLYPRPALDLCTTNTIARTASSNPTLSARTMIA